jgi:hypothetical protein
MKPEGSYPSPGGEYAFHIRMWEARMSHWIESFVLIESTTRRPLIAFTDPNWSLDEARWLSSSVVRLTVRKYPGDHTPSQFTIEADCGSSLARVQDGTQIPFAQVETKLEWLLRHPPNA